jgi:hypothetical protein
VSHCRASRIEERAIVASNTDNNWHCSDTTPVVTPVTVVRCSRSSNPSAKGGTTALPLDGQFTR